MAGLLSMTSRRILSRYSSKVLLVFAIGLLLAARDVISWTLAGLVIARFMRAPTEAAEAAQLVTATICTVREPVR